MPDEPVIRDESSDLPTLMQWYDTLREFKFAEPQESKHGEVRISVDSPTVVAGTDGDLVIQYKHLIGLHTGFSNDKQVYNPYFDKFLHPPSFAVAVFDDRKKFVTDLAWCEGLGPGRVLAEHFMDLDHSGCIVGTHFIFSTEASGEPEPPFEFPRLAVGRWKLQVILFDRFYPMFRLTGPHFPNEEDLKNGANPNKTYGLESDHHDDAIKGWLQTCPGKEFLRSNIVEIEVVPPRVDRK